MSNQFLEKPILNTSYDYPARHWELDADGKPTLQINNSRCRAEFITSIPKPKKQTGKPYLQEIIHDDGMSHGTSDYYYVLRGHHRIVL